MQWKARLRLLENNKQWDDAIAFMERIICENPNDKEAYIFMNYFLMNLLVEENHDENKHDHYESLIKKYFQQSYAKYYNDPEYLFFTGITATMSEWYFGITVADYEAMFKKAMELAPDNLLYKDPYYINLDQTISSNKKLMVEYAQIIIDVDSPIKNILTQKGALGEYLLDLMTHWSLDILKNSTDH